jgi:hypothetical protein
MIGAVKENGATVIVWLLSITFAKLLNLLTFAKVNQLHCFFFLNYFNAITDYPNYTISSEKVKAAG